MASLLVAAVFGAAVQAIALESTIAQATDASIPHPTFQLPKVTEPPNPSAVHELLKRADVETVLVGPDNTCGYVSGLLGAAYTCQDQNAVCAFVTAANTGYAACCDDSNCAFVADCMDASQVENGDCNNGCMNDIYTAKCTASSAPYCGTIRFDTSITDYFCHSLSYSTAMDALTTWIGENDGRSFSEVVVTLTSSSFGDESGGLASSSTRSASGASSSGDVQSGSSSSTTSGASTSTSAGAAGGQKSSTPVGAIAGGVVGGVAVIALIGLGIWLILRRSRKQQANAVPPMTQQYPPAQQPQQPPSGYAPSPPGGAPGAPGAPLFGAAQPQTTPSYDYQQQQPSYQNGAVMHTYDGSKPQQWGTPSPPPQGGANGGFNTAQQGGGVWYPNNQDTTATTPGSPGSPMTYNNSDPRLSMAQPPSSPASTTAAGDRMSAFQPQLTGNTLHSQSTSPQPHNMGSKVPSTVYEAGGDAVGTQGQGQLHANHHGQFHELS